MRTVYLETPYTKYCIYMCVRDIDFDCFCDIFIGFWNCFDSMGKKNHFNRYVRTYIVTTTKDFLT